MSREPPPPLPLPRSVGDSKTIPAVEVPLVPASTFPFSEMNFVLFELVWTEAVDIPCVEPFISLVAMESVDPVDSIARVLRVVVVRATVVGSMFVDGETVLVAVKYGAPGQEDMKTEQQ